MAAPPYMKLFWGDYHKVTRHLTRSQHGAYFLLIGEAWQRGAALPDDDAKLAAWALCTPEEWAAMRPTIMEFFTLRRGKWWHDRVREELASYEATSRKRQEAGKKGGKASRGKDKGNTEANANLKPTKPEPEPEPKKETTLPARDGVDDWPEGQTLKHAEALCLAVGSALLDTARSPGLIQSLGRLHAWRRDGASWAHDVIPTIQAKMAGRTSPITTWSYFDQPIAEAKARRLQPLPDVELTDDRQPARHARPENGHDERRRAHLELLAEQRDAAGEDQRRPALGR